MQGISKAPRVRVAPKMGSINTFFFAAVANCLIWCHLAKWGIVCVPWLAA